MIKNIVCRGFGPGATIAFVCTRGYSIGAAAASSYYILECLLRNGSTLAADVSLGSTLEASVRQGNTLSVDLGE